MVNTHQQPILHSSSDARQATKLDIPREKNAWGYVVLKRNKTLVYVQLDDPMTAIKIKTAMIPALQSAPSGTHLTHQGEELDTRTLTLRDITLGTLSDKNEIVDLSDDAVAPETGLFWRLENEEYNVTPITLDEDDFTQTE